jgi:hypothetical protein
MPTKNSQNLNVTTSSSVGVDSKGKTFSRSSTTTSQTITKRRMTRGETAGGLLTTIGQLQMIGISIIVLAIGTSVAQFQLSDLVVTTPNYNVQNTYIPIDDPLNNVNYIQYGEEVFNRFFHEDYGFIVQLGAVADIGNNIYSCFEDFEACLNRSEDLQNQYQEEINNPAYGTFIDEFGSEDFLLYSYMASQVYGYQTPYAIYLEMSTLEREFIRDEQENLSAVEIAVFNDYTPAKFYLFGFTNPLTDSYYWGYFVWPSIYEIILELGV